MHSDLNSLSLLLEKTFLADHSKRLVLKYMTYDIVCINKQYYYNFQINVTVSSWMMNLMIRVGMETWEMER